MRASSAVTFLEPAAVDMRSWRAARAKPMCCATRANTSMLCTRSIRQPWIVSREETIHFAQRGFSARGAAATLFAMEAHMESEGGSAKVQAMLWGASPRDWAEGEERRTAQLVADVLGALRIQKGTRLLDAGCGAGRPATEAAKHGAVVTGLDASPAMVEYARPRLPEGRFDAGDIEALPYRDSEFDAAMAITPVFYSPDVAHGMAGLPP